VEEHADGVGARFGKLARNPIGCARALDANACSLRRATRGAQAREALALIGPEEGFESKAALA
jgi:hypothetical protein